jgi:hypothetical protein
MRRILAVLAVAALASPSLAQDVGQARFRATILRLGLVACSPVLTPEFDQCGIGQTLEWAEIEFRVATAGECEAEGRRLAPTVLGQFRSAYGPRSIEVRCVRLADQLGGEVQ